MDPEAKRVTSSRKPDSRDLGIAGSGYWRSRSGRTDRLSPYRVFAVDFVGDHVQWTRGGRFGDTFVATESSWGSLADDGARSRFHDEVAGRALSVSIPDSLVIRRTFRLPTKDPREIEAMLGYQLGPGLPVDLRELQWSWCAVAQDDDATVVMVELCRRDALVEHLAPLTEAGADVDRVVPEAWLLATRLRDLSDADESSGLFVRPDGVVLVVQSRGSLAFAARISARPISAPDVEGTQRRAMQQSLEDALEPARTAFENAFSRPLPPLTVIVDPEQSARDRDIEVVVANALGAQPAGVRLQDDGVPWRGVALAAAASVPGPSLLGSGPRRRSRRRNLAIHAVLVVLATVVALGVLGESDLRRLEERRDALRARSAEQVASSADLAAMQAKMHEAARQRQGSREPLHTLLAVQRHATSDFVIDRLTYLANANVEITGSARDVSSVIKFSRKLEAEDPFVATAVRNLSEVEHDGAARVRFVLEGAIAR